MQTKLIIALVVVAAVAVAVYFFSPRADAPTIEDGASSSETTGADSASGMNESGSVENVSGTESDTAQAQTKATAPSSQTTTAAPKPSAPASSAAPSLPYSATIYYDGGRFIPDEVTIVEGGTVRFVNGSDTIKMWIASNNHPTHTVYPIKTDNDCKGSSFDQCASVGSGGSWSFTFERFGTWGFHNHERARDTGKVIVKTREDYLKSI